MGRDLFATTGRDLFADFDEPEPVEEKGYFGNTFRRIGERATELGGQLVVGADVVATAAEEAIPLGGFVFEEDSILPTYKSPEEFKSLSDQGMTNIVAAGGERLKGMDFGSTPVHTWDEVKRHFSEEGVASGMGEVLKYAGETGAASIPDMAFAILNLPGYVMARSSEIGETRAINKGKDQTDLVDIMEAAPFALGSAILERIGGKAITDVYSEAAELIGKGALKVVAGKAGKAAATEAGTEFVQEGIIEYVGEKFGTDAKMDMAEALERGVAGAVAGGIYGGAAGGTVTALSDPTKRIEDALKAEVESAEYVTSIDEIARKRFDPGQDAALISETLNAATSIDEVVDIANQSIDKLIATPKSEMTTNELLNALPQDMLAIVQEQPIEEILEGAEPAGRDLFAESEQIRKLEESIAFDAIEKAEQEQVAADVLAAEVDMPIARAVDENLRFESSRKTQPINRAISDALLEAGADPAALKQRIVEDQEFRANIISIKQRQEAEKQEAKQRKRRQINPLEDDIQAAIAKAGGMEQAEASAQGFDPAGFKLRPKGGKGFPLFTKGGMSADALAETLAQDGYFEGEKYTANGLVDRLNRSLAGEFVGTPSGAALNAQREYEEDLLLRTQDEAATEALIEEAIARDDHLEEGTASDKLLTERFMDAVREGVPLERITEIVDGTDDTAKALTELKEAIENVETIQQGIREEEFIAAAEEEIPFGDGQTGQTDEEIDALFGITPTLELVQETEESARAKAEADIATQKAVEAEKKAAETKAKAAEEVSDFVLTGSERVADVAEARGQRDLLADIPSKQLADIRIAEDRETETGDIVQVSRKADKIMTEIDGRIDSMKLLAECVRG